MWGGSYLVANETGKAQTNVVRLYCIINLPQGTSLDKKENFDQFIKIYYQTFQQNFLNYGLHFMDPQWGEPIPYSNKTRPTTTLQMWEKNQQVKFLRAFFIWNKATWEDSIIYDAIRNVRQIKELLDLNRHPGRRSTQELKFLLQDVLIIYFTLMPALNLDFIEHAEPIIQELLQHFLNGLHDENVIEDLFHKVYSNALVYGLEEALEEPYKKNNLNIYRIEDWPEERINWVPKELNEVLGPYLKNTFSKFKNNLDNLG